MQPNPMCSNIRNTLLADPPATKIAKDKSRFPAAVKVPGING